MNSWIGLTLITAGAVIMFLNFFRYRSVLAAMPFIDPSARNLLRHLIQAHGGLMVFFLLGYAVTAFAFFHQWQIVGETFVGLIFAFGAVFIYLGLSIQSRFVNALMTTMERLVSMCASCKRVRIPGAGTDDAGAWQRVDLRYCHESLFSHGICPDCAERLYGSAVGSAPIPQPE